MSTLDQVINWLFLQPDNIVWSWHKWSWGYQVQKYGWGASCTTRCIGPLTLRWHQR